MKPPKRVLKKNLNASRHRPSIIISYSYKVSTVLDSYTRHGAPLSVLVRPSAQHTQDKTQRLLYEVDDYVHTYPLYSTRGQSLNLPRA